MNVDEERVKAVKCLRELRNYLTDDNDLKLPIHDEKFLIRFVRARKYDAKLAHSLVRKYFTLRQKNPSVFKIALPSNDVVREILETHAIVLLKNKDVHGRTVMILNPWDVEKYTLDQWNAAYTLICEEVLLMSLEAQTKGIVSLLDGKIFGTQHLKQFTIKRMKFMAAIAQESFPIRSKGCHCINQPTITDVVIAALSPFMSEKSKKNLVLHGNNFEKLHELVPAEILPETFGGKLTEDEAYDTAFTKRLLSHDNYYQDLLEFGFGNWESDNEDTYM